MHCRAVDVVGPHEVERSALDHRDIHAIGPEVLADQGRRAGNLVENIFRNPLPVGVMYRVDCLAELCEPPDDLVIPIVVFILGLKFRGSGQGLGNLTPKQCR